MRKLLLQTIFMLSILMLTVMAQEADENTSPNTDEKITELNGKVDGIHETVLELKSTLDALKKIKISGYVQTQFQSAEIDGAKTGFSGGDFAATLHNRFAVRRGRIKFNYDNDLTQYVLQLDATERGLGLKDAYLSFKEPWLKTVSITAGVFDRPFGFEISYSSGSRETPERSRLFQTLFPGERDLGFKVEAFPASGIFSLFNFKGGFFAGNGVASETDNAKDFIGRLGFSVPFEEQSLVIDGGFSGYFGGVRLDDAKKTYKINSLTAAEIDSTARYVDRTYLGMDLQLYYDLPVLGGLSLRGEFITGQQPGTAGSSSFHRVGDGDIYLRKFTGYYLLYLQNIGMDNQFVAKYDVYDPNTSIAGDEIATTAANKIGAADARYATLGLGWIYHWDANIKLTAYYEMVKNETSSKMTVLKEDLKDNIFTLRMQYRF